MEWIIAGLLCCLAAFAAVVLFGAPYLPTLRPQIVAAFELLALKPGQTLFELGCGDGKVLIAAAEAGYKAIGIELNPLLVIVARLRTHKYRANVQVRWGNYWRMSWPEADGVFVFLLDRFMPKLDERMQQYKKPLASVTFKIPGKKIAKEYDGVFLYLYR